MKGPEKNERMTQRKLVTEKGEGRQPVKKLEKRNLIIEKKR